VRHRTIHDAAVPTIADRSWIWSQHWRDLLFLHWHVPVAAVHPHIPAPLEVATHDGAAWVSLVLFRLRVRPRWLPFLPGVSALVEVNLRTYVRYRAQEGIWFLSVHADNRWAIRLGRLLSPLPYAHAAMHYERRGDQFHFQAWQGPTSAPASAFTFRPAVEGSAAREHSLDEWLLERYRLFARGRRGALVQAEVAHPPWVLHGAALSVTANHFGRACGLDLSRAPQRAHFSPGVLARFGAFRRLEDSTLAGGRRNDLSGRDGAAGIGSHLATGG
jgi:uncharacterized protein YqjF (DUF2071 family)